MVKPSGALFKLPLRRRVVNLGCGDCTPVGEIKKCQNVRKGIRRVCDFRRWHELRIQ